VSPRHPQVYVKVNAKVDAGIASLISALSRFPLLETFESCQGDVGGENEAGQPAVVFFSYGSWEEVVEFVFNFLAPRLNGQAMFSARNRFDGAPTVEMEMPADLVNQIAIAINLFVKEREGG